MAAQEQDLDTEINKALLKRKDEIVKGLVEGAIESISRDLGWKAQSLAAEAVTGFMKEHVVPGVQAHLESHKAAILAKMIGSIEDALETAGKKLAETAAKNLASSWNLKKVVEGMFG